MAEGWDFSRKFSTDVVGVALSRLWTIQGSSLTLPRDVMDMVPQCPISCEPFKDPVLLSDGLVYERKHIKKWLEKSNMSPCTNEKYSHTEFLKLRSWHDATSKFLLEDSKRQVTRDDWAPNSNLAGNLEMFKIH